MKKFVASLVTIFLATTSIGASAAESRVKVEGDLRVVGLLHWSKNELPGCAGTLLGPRLVLTVGHCLSHETADGKRPSYKTLPPEIGEIPDSRTIWITYPGETVVNGAERKVATGIAQFFTNRFRDGGCNENYTICKAPEFDFGVIVLDRELPYAPIKLASDSQVKEWASKKVQASIIGIGAISYEDFHNVNGATKSRSPMKVTINLQSQVADYVLTDNEKGQGNIAAHFKFINGVNPGGVISGSPVFYEEDGTSYYLGALSSIEGASIMTAPNDPIWQDVYWKNNAGGKIYLASYFNDVIDEANKYLSEVMIREAKAKQEAEAKAKQEAEAKAKQEAEAAAAVKKIITIKCVKGKTVKKVTSVNPKCPQGYKKK